MTVPQYQEYTVWDAPTRWFHWINALAVISLTATGLVILNDDALGLSARALRKAWTGDRLMGSLRVP